MTGSWYRHLEESLTDALEEAHDADDHAAAIAFGAAIQFARRRAQLLDAELEAQLAHRSGHAA